MTKNASTGTMSIYINGELWHQESGKNRLMSGIDWASIGVSRHSHEGIIDEFVVSETVRDDSWIKLTYENQRKESSVVMIE